MATVYSYSRFSNPEQARGDSLRRQQAAMESWVQREGHSLDASLDLHDAGVSAYRGRNADASKGGALGEFLEAVKDGRVKPGSILCVESLDRVSRQGIGATQRILGQILDAGISVKTFVPDDLIRPGDLDNLLRLMTALLVAQRAFEESQTKSHRLRTAWAAKRADGTPMSGVGPEWLKAERGPDGKTLRFVPVPERVAVVRRIFTLAGSGHGYFLIARALNADGVQPFGRGKSRAAAWCLSSVRKILTNRAVLGEHQPCIVEAGRRVPAGEPRPNYFPQVVSQAEFHAAAVRRTASVAPGRVGSGVPNLFAGIAFDARDGSRIKVRKRGSYHVLVSSGATNGEASAEYVSFPYRAFEASMLVLADDLQLSDVMPPKHADRHESLSAARGRLAELTDRAGMLKARLTGAGTMATAAYGALTDALVAIETERAEVTAAAQRLEAELSTPEGESLGRVKQLVAALRSGAPDERRALRLKMRASLRRLVTRIDVLVVRVGSRRAALLDVALTSGVRRKLTVTAGPPVELPHELEELDLRDYRNWPEGLRAALLGGPGDGAELARLDAEGLGRAEIARRSGLSLSHVGRLLAAAGRRKRTRKPANAGWEMSWAKGARGWAKMYRGRRFYIGVAALAKAYPSLVESRDAAGSWRAANAWWAAKLNGL